MFFNLLHDSTNPTQIFALICIHLCV